MVMNKPMVVAGICTLLQAVGQLIFTTLGLTQHFCVIDFLIDLPLLLYIRILYFHNPNGCGPRINIGQSIEQIANQAFVLLTQEPFTAFRTFIINCTSLGLSVLWIVTSLILIMGGAENKQSKHVRWPWIIVTVSQCAVDLVATVTYANDSFHTTTLSDVVEFIGGTVSGIANEELNTAWAAWTMVLLYSRFVILFVLNVFFVIMIIVECNVKRETKTSAAVQVEAQTFEPVPTPTPAAAVAAPQRENASDQPDVDRSSTPSTYYAMSLIPRAGLNRSFRKMKNFLFRRSPPAERETRSQPESFQASPQRSPRPQRAQTAADKKRTVNFPEGMSLRHRLENMMTESNRRLDRSVGGTGRRSPPALSQSLPHLESGNLIDSRGRRGTTAELQGQLPWAYIPAPTRSMRDQLPDDEYLPPVPLPDYTAIPTFRRTSVHRAASSLSSLTQKKDYASHSTRPPLTQSDVLY